MELSPVSVGVLEMWLVVVPRPSGCLISMYPIFQVLKVEVRRSLSVRYFDPGAAFT